MTSEDEAARLMVGVRDLGLAARDPEVFTLLEGASDDALIRVVPTLLAGGTHEARFAAYRDGARAILERRLFERLRQTMIDLDKTAGRLQTAVYWATVVTAALTGVATVAAVVALWRAC